MRSPTATTSSREGERGVQLDEQSAHRLGVEVLAVPASRQEPLDDALVGVGRLLSRELHGPIVRRWRRRVAPVVSCAVDFRNW
jgi:hypothetical protein